MAKETEQIMSPEIAVEEWLQRDFGEEPGREFGVSLLRLKRQLSGRRVGILIDNLEPALDRQGKIISPHRGYVELLRILTDRDGDAITLITSRDRVGETDINLIHYRLSGLNLDAWRTYFQRRHLAIDLDTITNLHTLYGGNAKAMEIIAGTIISDFDGDVVSYAREYRDRPLGETQLKNLIAYQFDRLHSLDPDAYNLLCRLGCYRYQDLPQLERDALVCLLADVSTDRSLEIINSLKNRSLLEFSRGKYCIHPAIRAEAIARLRPDLTAWQQTHTTIADFWTNSVHKITDLNSAITALEAYYHYLEIGDFYRAGQVLLKPRDNQWGQFLPLGSTLYRMGAIQPILTAIDRIIPHLPRDRSTAELYNILGDIYWIKGDVRAAISAQQQTISYATEELIEAEELIIAERNPVPPAHHHYYLKMLEVDSLLSLGLYHIDLWELEIAKEQFQQVIGRASNTHHDRWAQKAKICLALVLSILGDRSQSQVIIKEIEKSIFAKQLTGSSAYFLQKLGQTYTNLADFSAATEIYQQTLTFCKTGNYLQIQAKTLAGLAELDRLQGRLEAAKDKYLHAIEDSDRLGAKCDLAEVYFQAAITWNGAGEVQQSNIYLEKAEQLFTEISAPKQIAKLQFTRSSE
jgi:tetratricopeptide (TPR) repeat protein